MTNKYISPGSGVKVSFAKYLGELLVIRQAKNKGVRLPLLYWKNPEYVIWTKELRNQIVGVNRILKVYESDVILRTFLQNDWVYSIYSPKFADLLREENRKPKIEITKVDVVENITGIPKKFGKKSMKNKLL